MWKITLEDDRLVFTPFFGDTADQDPDQSLAEYQKLRERYARCEMDLQNRDEEIRDLKLENDRLQKRDELAYQFIHDLACVGCCSDCQFKDNCPYDENVAVNVEDKCKSLLSKLEDLG